MSASESEKPRTEGASASEPPAGAADDRSKRAQVGFFTNVRLSAQHIKESVNSEGSKFRGSDYISIIAVPVVAVVLMAVSSSPMGLTIRPFMVMAICLALLYFIGKRIGVVRALTPRQANLVWTILVATFILGICFAFLTFEIMRSI